MLDCNNKDNAKHKVFECGKLTKERREFKEFKFAWLSEKNWCDIMLTSKKA